MKKAEFETNTGAKYSIVQVLATVLESSSERNRTGFLMFV